MQVPHRKPGKWTHFAPDLHMTRVKYEELKQKLIHLKDVARPKAAAEVARLAELGDFSENVEYQMAKGRLRGINERILLLQHQLRQAVIIESHATGGIVQIGSTVTVECDGVRRIYQILGSSESDPKKGIISHVSPMGAALLGRKSGDSVAVVIAEKEKEYRIVAVA